MKFSEIFLGYLKKSDSESCIFTPTTTDNNNNTNQDTTDTNLPNHSLIMSSISHHQRDNSANNNNNKTQYFNRVNSNRQSSVRNASENGHWSASQSSESSPSHM